MHIYPKDAKSDTGCIICGTWRDESNDIPCTDGEDNMGRKYKKINSH